MSMLSTSRWKKKKKKSHLFVHLLSVDKVAVMTLVLNYFHSFFFFSTSPVTDMCRVQYGEAQKHLCVVVITLIISALACVVPAVRTVAAVLPALNFNSE